jgi:segregation and condensation protein B
MTERGEMEAALEAILFVVSEPVPRSKLLELFDEEERPLAEEALAAVLARYAAGEARGVMAEEVAGGVRLVTRPEMVGWLRRFFDASASNKLSMAALETLAIIAYRQPVTAPEIQELRSVNPTGVLKTLLERRLVRIAGRKEVVGKPFLYTTTREFLVHFGLNHLRDLPPLEEFEETFGAAAATVGGASGGTALPPLQTPLDDDREERFLREAAALADSDSDAEPETAEPEAAEPEAAETEGAETEAAEHEPGGKVTGEHLTGEHLTAEPGPREPSEAAPADLTADADDEPDDEQAEARAAAGEGER